VPASLLGLRWDLRERPEQQVAFVTMRLPSAGRAAADGAAAGGAITGLSAAQGRLVRVSSTQGLWSSGSTDKFREGCLVWQ
jgi:hypothetical protein